jgi:hypothetical protein
MNLEKGNLDVKIIYGGEEILGMNTILEEGNIKEEIIKETETLEEINETGVPEETNQSINETLNETHQVLPEIVKDSLTEEEKEILNNEFGNDSVEIIKSEIFNGRVIIGYKLENYEAEFSYDSDLSKEVLESEMEKDRIKWLKDIAFSLVQKEYPHEGINITNYSYGF